MLYFSYIRVKKSHLIGWLFIILAKLSYKISSKRATGDTSKPEINP